MDMHGQGVSTSLHVQMRYGVSLSQLLALYNLFMKLSEMSRTSEGEIVVQRAWREGKDVNAIINARSISYFYINHLYLTIVQIVHLLSYCT